jgi:hypothetical protein
MPDGALSLRQLSRIMTQRRQLPQASLDAFQQVEDNLATLHILKQEAQQQQRTVASARESLQLFTNRYKGGVDTYLQVITASDRCPHQRTQPGRHPAAAHERRRAPREGARRRLERRGSAAVLMEA